MKYNTLNLGQIEALVNKLGGMDGVQKFLSGELIVASPVMSSETAPNFIHDKTKDGWKLLENVTDSKEIKISDLELVSFLKRGESYINGEEMARRAKELKCNIGQQHAEYLLANQDQIPEEFRKYYLVFPGTAWRRPEGDRCVPFLSWDGVRWSLDFVWLDDGWSGDSRLLQSRK